MTVCGDERGQKIKKSIGYKLGSERGCEKDGSSVYVVGLSEVQVQGTSFEMA